MADAPVAVTVIVVGFPSTHPLAVYVNDAGIVYVEPVLSTKNPWPVAPVNASVVVCVDPVASTKTPCVVGPVYASVADCVDPVTGAATTAYTEHIPLCVGVAVNVTRPDVVLYAVTVQLLGDAAVPTDTVMYCCASAAIPGPLSVSVRAVDAVPTTSAPIVAS